MYLGLPELFGRKKRDIFASILDRIRQRIKSWTTRYLSGAGKQVLLKAVLAAMPNYAMSCFKLPMSLCKQIQSLLTRFWWDANPETRKMCWVAWTTLTKPKYAGGLGFRDIESVNDALLAKIGWRLIREPNSLLAQVLLGKYARYSNFMDCQTPAAASHGWKSILEGRKLLRKGLGWVVGNGQNIKVWSDPWLSLSHPSTPIGPPTESSVNLTVSDLLCPLTNEWNVERIRHHVPQYEETIKKIITSSAPMEDEMVWLSHKSGSYSTKSGYGLTCNSTQSNIPLPSDFDWMKHLWNLKTSPKLKDFLWKVMNGAIPVSSNLEKRGFPSFTCKRCGGIEDEHHVFFSCTLAVNAWELAPLTEKPDAFFPSFSLLLMEGAKMIDLPPTGLSVPLWPWICWNLWKARNKLCFDDKCFSGQEVMLKAIKDAREWQEAQQTTNPPDGTTIYNLRPRGSTARAAVLGPTCHVDAAWNPTTEGCGIGGVFHGLDQRTPPNICYSRRCISSALMAEAIAVRSAVMTAASSNIRSLTVLSDSKILISMLKTKESRPPLLGILFDIYHFSTLFDAISFVYVPRLENVEADHVAKSALSTANFSSSYGV